MDFGPEARALETSQQQARHGLRHTTSLGWGFDLIFSLCFAAVLATVLPMRLTMKTSPRALRKALGRHAKEFDAVPAEQLDASLLEVYARTFNARRSWWGDYLYNFWFVLLVTGGPDLLKMLPYSETTHFLMMAAAAAAGGATAGIIMTRVRRSRLLPELRRLYGF